MHELAKSQGSAHLVSCSSLLKFVSQKVLFFTSIIIFFFDTPGIQEGYVRILVTNYFHRELYNVL